MNLQQAQEQAAQFIIAEAVASMPKGMNAFQAKVTAVSPLFVSWNGGKPFPSPQLRGYSPAIGDEVLVLLINNGPVVIDAVEPV